MQELAQDPAYCKSTKQLLQLDSALRGQPEWLLDVMFGLVERVYLNHGDRAFELPRSAAATHEAGHAVLYGAAGFHVHSVAVFGKWLDGHGVMRSRKVWGGLTKSNGGYWEITPETPPEKDAAMLRFQMAGVIAEQLFEPEFHEGSSLDEVALSNAIAVGIAHKTGGCSEAIFIENCGIADGVLRRNEGVVRAIARKLMHERKIAGARLNCPLRGVM
jgi:hypothetical protein